MAGPQFRFSLEAMLAVASGKPIPDMVEVRWLVGVEERLSMDFTPSMVAGLRALPASFGRTRFARAIGNPKDAALILGHLLRREVVTPEARTRSLVLVQGPDDGVLARWTLPSRFGRIDLLVGDAASLPAHFTRFLAGRRPDRHVGWVRFGRGEVEVSPILERLGKLYPHRPAAPWPRASPRPVGRAFCRGRGRIAAHVRRAVAPVTPRRKRPGHLARLSADGRIRPAPTRSILSRRRTSHGLYRSPDVTASIEGRWVGSGILADPRLAEATARYEAIERLGISRPDPDASDAVSEARRVARHRAGPGVRLPPRAGAPLTCG